MQFRSGIYQRTIAVLLGATAIATQGAYAQKDIVDTAVEAGSFKTLVAAVQKAGLVEALKGAGPFTVFAPSDDAFAKLPAGAVDSLLANPDQLKAVLLFHVVSGKVMAKDLSGVTSAETLLGQPAAVSTKNGVTIGSAKVAKADIKATNGVIHVIDSVMMPKDLVGVAASNDQFSTLVAAVKAAGLAETLMGTGPFTVLAPTNDAFAKLPEGTLTSLLKPENKEKLQAILKYHVIPGRVLAADVMKAKSANTVQGSPVAIAVKRNEDGSAVVHINNANVVKTDIGALNGVIHVIDTVILPESK